LDRGLRVFKGFFKIVKTFFCLKPYRQFGFEYEQITQRVLFLKKNKLDLQPLVEKLLSKSGKMQAIDPKLRNHSHLFACCSLCPSLFLQKDSIPTKINHTPSVSISKEFTFPQSPTPFSRTPRTRIFRESIENGSSNYFQLPV